MNGNAARLGLRDCDEVWVQSPYGKVKARAKLSRRIHREVSGLQHGFGHTALGRQARERGTSDALLRPTKPDPLSGQGLHKEACVRIVRASRAMRRAVRAMCGTIPHSLKPSGPVFVQGIWPVEACSRLGVCR